MKPAIFDVWNPKGGQGKSTLALSLVGAASARGLKPVIICQDQQGTSWLYGKSGGLPFEVLNRWPRLAPAADLVLVDHQASDWQFPRKAKLAIMPLQAARDQYAAYADALALAKERLPAEQIITVVMNYHWNRRPERKVGEALEKRGGLIVPASGAVIRASEDYTTVFDPALNRVYGIPKLRKQFNAVLDRALAAWAALNEEK